MNPSNKKIAAVIVAFLGVAIAGVSLFASQRSLTQNQPIVSASDAESFGAFNPTGGGTYTLQASISASQNTITLTSFTEPGSGVPYTMAYINTDVVFGTIAPSSGNSEFVKFTGITQNGNGTATLTGVTRGLARTPGVTGCVASTTLAHAFPGQTQFILSNSPCFYEEFYILKNNATSTGVLAFSSTTPPHYDGFGPNFANFSTTTLASVAYVNNLVNGAQTGFWNSNVTDIYNNNAGNVGVGTSTPFGKLSIVGDIQQYGNYMHFGAVAPNNTACTGPDAPSACLELWGDDNTLGGSQVQLGVGNINPGSNAYSGFFLANDLAADDSGEHYAFIALNSSTYNDNSFGAGIAIPNQLSIQNTDGPITILSRSYFNVFGGSGGSSSTSTGREILRVSQDGFFSNATSTFIRGADLLMFNATSTTATSTVSGALSIGLIASSSKLVVSRDCTGCGMSYVASSTNITSTGSITFTGSIPTLANNGLLNWTITEGGSGIRVGNFALTRTGQTSVTITNDIQEVNGCTYVFDWSGANLVVTETDTEADCSISGTMYWYK